MSARSSNDGNSRGKQTYVKRGNKKRAKSRHTVPVMILVLSLMVGALGLRLAFRIYDRYAYPLAYTELVEQYAEERELPPSLIYAVICCESGFDKDALSNVGAKGLMQMVDGTFEWAQMREGKSEYLSPSLLYDPQVNVKYGTLVLKLLLEDFETEENAVAAYHAGWGSVKEWLGNPEYSQDGKTLSHIPFGDTRSYVKKVMKTREKYQELYGIL